MPELPEVEVVRTGLAATAVGRTVTSVERRAPALRWPIPDDLPERLAGRTLEAVERRGKYLLLAFDTGWLIVHLGMSGTLAWARADLPLRAHDHLDLVFGDGVLRLNDPRRFGAVLWHDAADGPPQGHPLLASLGIEPFSGGFDGALLHAGIRPSTPARNLTRPRCDRLADAIRTTLSAAIAAGGSTLRDFVSSEGASGYFQLECNVYDRAGQPCRACGEPVRMRRDQQRATYWCVGCQR